MLQITFSAGSGRHFNTDVNYMLSADNALYAECVWPEGTPEDYGYFALKAAIINLAAAYGIAPGKLSFFYDGQEQYLGGAAAIDCDVYTDYAG